MECGSELGSLLKAVSGPLSHSRTVPGPLHLHRHHWCLHSSPCCWCCSFLNSISFLGSRIQAKSIFFPISAAEVCLSQALIYRVCWVVQRKRQHFNLHLELPIQSSTRSFIQVMKVSIPAGLSQPPTFSFSYFSTPLESQSTLPALHQTRFPE